MTTICSPICSSARYQTVGLSIEWICKLHKLISIVLCIFAIDIYFVPHVLETSIGRSAYN